VSLGPGILPGQTSDSRRLRRSSSWARQAEPMGSTDELVRRSASQPLPRHATRCRSTVFQLLCQPSSSGMSPERSSFTPGSNRDIDEVVSLGVFAISTSPVPSDLQFSVRTCRRSAISCGTRAKGRSASKELKHPGRQQGHRSAGPAHHEL
jgi:hypothetical protein